MTTITKTTTDPPTIKINDKSKELGDSKSRKINFLEKKWRLPCKEWIVESIKVVFLSKDVEAVLERSVDFSFDILVDFSVDIVVDFSTKILVCTSRTVVSTTAVSWIVVSWIVVSITVVGLIQPVSARS